MAEPTDQELAVMSKWTICTKFKAMHQPKAVEVELCRCGQCNSSHRKGWERIEKLMRRQKKTPPKAGSLGFLLGVLPRFHSVKKPSSQINNASEIWLSKPLRISWLTDLQ